MLRVANVEEIEGLLLQLPQLIEQQERKSTEFARLAGDWLTAFEKILASNRLHQVATVATLRSTLLAAKQGQIPAALAFRGRPTRWRVANAIASEALRRATELATALLEEHKSRFAEAERVAQQIVAVAASRNLLRPRPPAVGLTDYLRGVRAGLIATPELAPAVVHLESLVGPHDALIFIDRALGPYEKGLEPEAPALPSPSP